MALASLVACPARAEGLRIATYDIDMDFPSPGAALAHAGDASSPRMAARARVLAALGADVLLLTDIDFDAEGRTARALADRLAALGQAYPYILPLRGNAGVPAGRDLDGDGAVNGPGDRLAPGAFPGQGGMALLSRLPIRADLAQDLSGIAWADLPGSLMPPALASRAPDLPLSTGGHWIVPVELPDGRLLQLGVFAAGPPVREGEDEVAAARNHDETALWSQLLAGQLAGHPSPGEGFVLLGKANLDPLDGDGRPEAIAALLADPRLQDPLPKGDHARVEPRHDGDPALDTALFPGLGGLRLDYILPSAGLRVTGAGVLWPGEGTALAADLALAARHFPVWVDLLP